MILQMKTPVAKPKSTASDAYSSKPFFTKNGEGSFFSPSQEVKQPFFSSNTIQPKSFTPSIQRTADIETDLKNSKGKGRRLPDDARLRMESGFGVNFEHVRMHTDQSSVLMNQKLGAKAFTYGSDIYFNKGEYRPTSSEGQRLIAHELTHTIQQDNTTPSSNASSIRPRSIDKPVVQREVGRAQVRSSSAVLGRIRRIISRVDSSPRREAARIFGYTGAAAFGTIGLLTPLPPAALLAAIQGGGVSYLAGLLLGTHPVVQNLTRIVNLSEAFNPGAGRDAAGNAFVYTCTGGWIDLGHYFISALAGYLTGYNNAIQAGWWMEDFQGFWYRMAQRLDPDDLRAENIPIIGGLIGGNARSYYTVEDLPSDRFGSQLGDRMQTNASQLYPINSHVSTFFSNMGAVVPTGETLDAMMREITNPDGTPRQHRSEQPLLLNSASGICNGTDT